MPLRIALVSLLFAPAFAGGQSPGDWHYHNLPNGPRTAGVHRVLGHHRQTVPFYAPHAEAESFGPRTHVQYGWFGRFTPSPRPRTKTVGVQAPGGQ